MIPTKQIAYMLSAAKYYQGQGVISHLGEEFKKLGTKAWIVGGKTALSVSQKAICAQLDEHNIPYHVEEYNGFSVQEAAEDMAGRLTAQGYDVIIATGGGRLTDFAKMVAFFAKCKIITVPTSSATCSAVSAVSVRYTQEGACVSHSLKCPDAVDVCIADMDILMTQPPRLLLSGILDAMAKLPELEHYIDDIESTDLGIDVCLVLAKRVFEKGPYLMEKAVADLEKGICSKELEQAVYYSIVLTGAISGFARGSKQCALAHRFYESTRTLFTKEAISFSHGEIVAVGLYMQFFYNGQTEKENLITPVLKKWNMPSSLPELHIPAVESTAKKYIQSFVEHGILPASGPDYDRACAAMRHLLER